MRIDVALGPAEIERLSASDLGQTDCVVIDILRATSTMVTALGGGASAILPVSSIEEARDLKAQQPNRILGGERNGFPPEGFDLGNSPLEYCDIVKGREVVLTTTNGTWAIGRCHGARSIWIAALLNLAAAARPLTLSRNLLIICAGTFESPALEDLYAAGALIAKLRSLGVEAELSDSALLASALFERHGEAGSAACLAAARNGRALLSRGWQDQLDWCARFSLFDIAAVFDFGRVRVHSDRN